MSLLKLPTEVLLEIFLSPELELVDLKHLRLTCRTFAPLVADRLFRRLHLGFVPKDARNRERRKPQTTLTQKINSLVDGSSESEKSFRAADFKELSIVFETRQRNGFVTFTRTTARKLLALFEGLHVLEITAEWLPRLAMGRRDQWRGDPMWEGLDKFFLCLQERLEGGLKVEHLEFRGYEFHLPHVCWVAGLKSLALSIMEARPRFVPASTVDALVRIVTNNPGLERLCLRHQSEYEEEGGANVMDRILDRSGDLALKKLELGILRLPAKPQNVSKMKELEELSTYGHFDRVRDCGFWNGLRESGAKLRSAGGFVCAEMLDYVAKTASGGVEELELLPAFKFDLESDRILPENNEVLIQKFRDFTVPTLSQTLRSLTLYFQSEIPDGGAQITQRLSLVWESGEPDSSMRSGFERLPPGPSFADMMQLIRGLERLEELRVIVGRYADFDRYYLREREPEPGKATRERNERHLDIVGDWEYRGDGEGQEGEEEDEEKGTWVEGMQLTAMLMIDQQSRTYALTKTWVLRRRQEDGGAVWSLEPRNTVRSTVPGDEQS